MEKPVFNAVILIVLFSWSLLVSRLHNYTAWPREEKFDTKIVQDDSALIFTKMLGKIPDVIFYSSCGEIVYNPVCFCIILSMHRRTS